MSIDVLPPIEKEALILLLSGSDVVCCDLRSQLEHVVKIERAETGAGVYVIFTFDGNAKPLQDDKAFQLSGVFASSERCGEIGFILYIKKGLIDCLEAYSYGDTYPDYTDCDFTLKRE